MPDMIYGGIGARRTGVVFCSVVFLSAALAENSELCSKYSQCHYGSAKAREAALKEVTKLRHCPVPQTPLAFYASRVLDTEHQTTPSQCKDTEMRQAMDQSTAGLNCPNTTNNPMVPQCDAVVHFTTEDAVLMGVEIVSVAACLFYCLLRQIRK